MTRADMHIAPAVLDELIAQALGSARNAKAAPENAAKVLVAPELLRTDSGTVRVLFLLKLRARPDTTDRVTFELGSTRFGLAGVTQLINSLAAWSDDAARPPAAPPADASTSTSRMVHGFDGR